MKKITTYFYSLLAFTLLYACDTNEDELALEKAVAQFTATPTEENPNYIVLNNTSTGSHLLSSWKFKEDGPFVRGQLGMDTTYYPNEGTYKVTLYSGNDLGYDSVSQEVVIAQRDPDLPPAGGDNFLLLGDFEDGQVGDWNAWGQNVSVAANPAANAVNPSDQSLKVTQAAAWESSACRQIAQVNGKTLKIVVDVYFEVAGSLKLQIEESFETGYFQDVPAGEWVTLEYDLESEVDDATNYPWILFQGNTAGSYYLDNIKYYALDVAGGTNYGNFEDGQVGEWNAWSQAVTAVANPFPAPENSSEFVLMMSQTAAFETNAVRNGEVVEITAQKITLDVYFEQAGSLKLQLEEDFETGYFLDVEPGKWQTLEYDLVDQIDASKTYPWMVIQGNTPGNYYIDNITYHKQ